MDQAVGMYHFQCRSKRQRIFGISAAQLTKCQYHDRTQAFSACKQAVAHCVKQFFLRRLIGKTTS